MKFETLLTFQAEAICGRLCRGRVGGAGERDIVCVEAGSDVGVVVSAVAAG